MSHLSFFMFLLKGRLFNGYFFYIHLLSSFLTTWHEFLCVMCKQTSPKPLRQFSALRVCAIAGNISNSFGVLVFRAKSFSLPQAIKKQRKKTLRIPHWLSSRILKIHVWQRKVFEDSGPQDIFNFQNFQVLHPPTTPRIWKSWVFGYYLRINSEFSQRYTPKSSNTDLPHWRILHYEMHVPLKPSLFDK